jgi:hypothetical protein
MQMRHKFQIDSAAPVNKSKPCIQRHQQASCSLTGVREAPPKLANHSPGSIQQHCISNSYIQWERYRFLTGFFNLIVVLLM